MNQQILPCWLAGSQFLKIKFYWNTATLIYLHIVYGCFCITTAELSSYDRECMVCKAKNIYYLSFPLESLSDQMLPLDSIVIIIILATIMVACLHDGH